MKKQIYFCVAEKPSVAKSVTTILSRNSFITIQSNSKFNPVYQFDFNMNGQQIQIIFSSVTGHLLNHDFSEQYKNWKTTEQIKLLSEAPVTKYVDPTKVGLEKNLLQYSKNADVLFLWLDCDREGEAIAYEVISICQQVKPNIQLRRAHFSALTQQDVLNAVSNIQYPNIRLSHAVEARQEIDLRIGAAFTRFQTLSLQSKFSQLSKQVISYGPCQFPTLGFVVDQFKRNINFVSEEFWYIYCQINCNISEQQDQQQIQQVEFKWCRNHLFDLEACQIFYERCLNLEGKIIKIDGIQKSKWRPLPLATIELTKIGSKKLHITSAQLMEIAEKLYNKGFISYPRTETDNFSPNIDLKELINIQIQDEVWGQYAYNLVNNGMFQEPRKGKKDDKSHPPIHPVKILRRADVPDIEFRVYELVTRHFLACCSRDAKGHETKVDYQIRDEFFFLKGLIIIEKNYLDVYIYEKWNANTIPNFRVGDAIYPSILEIRSGHTTAPPLLTESELINQMDKNGIGTDATIHEHIKTIQERNYAIKINNMYFQPTPLGLALVETYEDIGVGLAKPQLRKWMEDMMQEIADGKMTKQNMLQQSTEKMIEVFLEVQSKKSTFIQKFMQYFEPLDLNQQDLTNTGLTFGTCGLCKVKQLELFSNNSQQNEQKKLQCTQCKIQLNLPVNKQIEKFDHKCPICDFQVLFIKGEQNSYNICPYCFNNPPDIEQSSNNMPCFKCQKKSCPLANKLPLKSLMQCNKCQQKMFVKQTKKNSFFLACENNLVCKNIAYFPDQIVSIQETDVICLRCNQNSLLCQLQFKGILHPDLEMMIIMEENPLICLNPGCNNELREMGYKFTSNNNNILQLQQKQQNNGLKCFKCQQPGHIATNCPNNNSQQQLQLNNNVLKCFKCQQSGHIASNCLNNNQNQQQQQNNNGIKCFKCQQPGHVSTNCPNNNKQQQQQSQLQLQQQQQNSNGIICYKCQQPGHIATNCPNNNNKQYQEQQQQQQQQQQQNSNSIICYKCQQPGHVATNCPNNNDKQQQEQKQQQQQQQNSNSIICYKCQKPGHVATNCPNNKIQQQLQQKQQNNNGIKCFKCQQLGHVATNCQNNNQKQQQQQQNSNGIKCYKCQQPGHVATNCPNNNQLQQQQLQNSNGIKCFKCQQSGHVSTKCPNNFK